VVGKPVGTPRRRWVDTIKIELREIGWGGMYWIELVHDRDRWKALAFYGTRPPSSSSLNNNI
jgi:hypothetical protein